MAKKYRKVAMGGTFELLHKGHLYLIRKALEVGNSVIIGLTSDEMVRTSPKNHPVAPFEERKKTLINLLDKIRATERVKIVPLNDPYGPTVTDRQVDALVVSYETFRSGDEINAIRRKKGFKPLELIVVGAVLAEDGLPISTTRILSGEIDKEGHVLSTKGE